MKCLVKREANWNCESKQFQRSTPRQGYKKIHFTDDKNKLRRQETKFYYEGRSYYSYSTEWDESGEIIK